MSSLSTPQMYSSLQSFVISELEVWIVKLYEL